MCCSARRRASSSVAPAFNASRYASSSCRASSSTISASRSLLRAESCRRWRTYADQSGMACSTDRVDGGDELFPEVALAGEGLAAVRREPVVGPPVLSGALDPGAGDQAAVLESRQDGV